MAHGGGYTAGMRCTITLACLLVLAAGCGGAPDSGEVAPPAEEVAEAQPAEVAAEEPAAPDESWLAGTWVLTHNPQNRPVDWVTFTAPDVAMLRRPDGTEVTGTYSIRDGKVVVKLPTPEGRTFTTSLEIAEEGTRLVNASGAYYTRS